MKRRSPRHCRSLSRRAADLVIDRVGCCCCPPRDGAGKNIQLNEWTGEVGGVLTVEIKPFASTYTMCGELCKTGGDRYTSVWKSRWCLLADGQLQYYGAYGDPKPKKILELKDATSITHPDQILEMIDVQMPDKLWQFKAPDILSGGEWWWKMRQASGQKADANEKGKEEDAGGGSSRKKASARSRGALRKSTRGRRRSSRRTWTEEA